LELAARYDLGNSYSLAIQSFDGHTSNPGRLSLQWWHSPDVSTEFGLLANLEKNKTSLE